MAGVAMQLLALLMLVVGSRIAFWAIGASCAVAIMPFTVLTVIREDVFVSDNSLWTDTIRASPYSWLAHITSDAILSKEGSRIWR